MERLTTDDPVEKMGMLQLMHNACYIKGGKVWYRDYDRDEDARALTRELLKIYTDSDDASCDQGFDNKMIDDLQYGTDHIEGLIALFYCNLCAMASLRERLKAYEDAELHPQKTEDTSARWIPVTERLPEKDDVYICTLSGELCGIDAPFTGICGLEDEKWDEEGCVIAWMPLPEPYRGE